MGRTVALLKLWLILVVMAVVVSDCQWIQARSGSGLGSSNNANTDSNGKARTGFSACGIKGHGHR